MLRSPAVYAHNDVPDVSQTYQHSVLVKNWYEDRFQGDVASASGRTQPTKERVVHEALPQGHPGLWQTTKAETEQKMLTTAPPGPNVATEAAKPLERHLITTNKELYETKPQQAVAANPEMFKSTKSPHGLTDTLTKSIRGEAAEQPNVAGGKGARGEITRRPGESGNVYGVSVFADEYAKWGTALKGVPLDETVSKNATKYF